MTDARVHEDGLRTSNDWGVAADTAYQAILGLLLRGDVQGGERLREQTLAELAGVSRTPVRQALNRLSAEGVVRLSRNKGAEVVALTNEDARALLEVRARFEPYAASLAVAHLTDADLDHLDGLTEQMKWLVDADTTAPLELGRLNNQFHAVFIQRCGNRHLSTAVQSLVMPATVARTFGRYTPVAMRRSLQHHNEIVEAARAGDADWVESVMRTHILAARHAFNPRGDRP